MSSMVEGLNLGPFGDDYWNGCEAEGRFPEEFWRHVAALRLPGAILSRENGGLGWGLRELTELVMEVVASGAGMGVYPLISNNLAGKVVEMATRESTKSS
jgi:alkylation response protein AidB-like acyl-CoA dehydrogenase